MDEKSAPSKDHLDLREGDEMCAVELGGSGKTLCPDQKRAKVMTIAREVMEEYEDSFRALAK